MAIFDDLPFRNYDVLIAEPNQVENGSIEFMRMLEDHDDGVSLPLRNDTAERAFPTRKFSWLLETRALKRDFYRFIYRIRGRQKVMWVPTWRQDFQMIDDVPPGEYVIPVKDGGFSWHELHETAIAILMTDGTFKYRLAGYGGEYESDQFDGITISLNQPLYQGLLRSEVVMICRMDLARLDHDLIELKHHTDELATAVTVFKDVGAIRNV